MDFKYLQYAIAVAKYGSMTKAAQSLFIAQPNLSRAIGELEAELGFALFIRSKKGMIPTLQGKNFLQEADMLLNKLEALAKQCREDSKQSFHFSCAPSCLLVNAILDVAGEEPDFKLSSKEYPSDQFIQNIVNQTSDAGFIILACPMKDKILQYFKHQGLCYHGFAQSPLIMSINKNSPLYHEEADPPYIDIDMAEVLINISYYEPIGIKFDNPPYPFPGKSLRHGASRAANVDMVNAIHDLVMLSCCFHPRPLKRNQLAAVPYRPDIPVYEYGYVTKQDQDINPDLQRILEKIKNRIQEVIYPK